VTAPYYCPTTYDGGPANGGDSLCLWPGLARVSFFPFLIGKYWDRIQLLHSDFEAPIRKAKQREIDRDRAAA